MTSCTRFLLLATLFALLTACGDIALPTEAANPALPTPQEPIQETVGTLNKADAQALASSSLENSELLGFVLSNPRDLLNPDRLLGHLGPRHGYRHSVIDGGLAAQSSSQGVESCVTFGGDNTDVDRDGVPVSYTLSVDCSYDAEGSKTFEMVSTLSDKDDSDPNSGFVAEVKDLAFNLQRGDQTISFTLDNSYDLTPSESGYSLVSKLTRSYQTPQHSGWDAHELTYTLIPDRSSAVKRHHRWQGGTVSFNGYVSWGDAEESASVILYSDGLHYPAGFCRLGFDSGSAKFSDGAGNELMITYQSCDGVSLVYNGEEISLDEVYEEGDYGKRPDKPDGEDGDEEDDDDRENA